MRAPGGPRLLLRRLREVMAEPVTAQARLDRIVVLIASNMVAEVCSLYVARADGRARAVRDRGPQSPGRPSDDHAAGRGPRRPHRLERRAARAVGRAKSSRLLLQAGDRRGNLPVLPRRAGVARRRHDRRARRPEPRPPHLFRGGGRGAADDGDAARRDDRLGPVAGPCESGRAGRGAQTDVAARRRHRGRARPRPCRLAPAAHHGVEDRRRRRFGRIGAAGDRDRGDARVRRRIDHAQRRRGRGRASRRSRGVPHDRPRPRLAAGGCAKRSAAG